MHSSDHDFNDGSGPTPDDERRQRGDRRSGRDRRGSGLRQPPSTEPRPYGFRSFDENRRCGQDRRLHGSRIEDWIRSPSDDSGGGGGATRGFVVLTVDEIQALLRDIDD